MGFAMNAPFGMSAFGTTFATFCCTVYLVCYFFFYLLLCEPQTGPMLSNQGFYIIFYLFFYFFLADPQSGPSLFIHGNLVFYMCL